MQDTSEMVGIARASEGVVDQEDWRVAMAADMVKKTEPLPGDGSTFLAKREY